MHIFRLILIVALLSFNFSSDNSLSAKPENSEEILSADPCLLGSWRVDIESMQSALGRPVSGSILITFEENPVNEITASFDVTIRRAPPQTQKREHRGTLSATMEHLGIRNNIGHFKLTRLEFGEESMHRRFKADGDWRDSTERTMRFLSTATYYYQDCTPTMMIGMHRITLNKEP